MAERLRQLKRSRRRSAAPPAQRRLAATAAHVHQSMAQRSAESRGFAVKAALLPVALRYVKRWLARWTERAEGQVGASGVIALRATHCDRRRNRDRVGVIVHFG